jgi:hypothetical protein
MEASARRREAQMTGWDHADSIMESCIECKAASCPTPAHLQLHVAYSQAVCIANNSVCRGHPHLVESVATSSGALSVRTSAVPVKTVSSFSPAQPVAPNWRTCHRAGDSPSPSCSGPNLESCLKKCMWLYIDGVSNARSPGLPALQGGDKDDIQGSYHNLPLMSHVTWRINKKR